MARLLLVMAILLTCNMFVGNGLAADAEKRQSVTASDQETSKPAESVAGKEEKVPEDGSLLDYKEMILDDVVVTASRRDIPIEDAPASVTIIDAATLQKFPLKTVDDVLREVAGVDVWGSNFDPLGHRAVTIRGVGGGSSQERTLILIDGIPVNDSWSGAVAWNQISKEDIARIEVVRGPSSSIYGTNAMGGVINIITKMPQKAPASLTLKGSYGELNSWSTYGNLSGTISEGRFGYYASGKKFSTDGYIAIPENEPHRSKNSFDTGNLFGQAFWYIDDHSYLKGSATYYREQRNKGYEFSALDPGEITKGNLTYRRDAPEGIDWLGILYAHGETQRHENDTRWHDAVNRITEYDKPFYGAILQPSFEFGDWNTLTVGTEYKFSMAEQEDKYLTASRRTRTEGKQQYFGLYAQDEIFLFDNRLILSPGARYDWWESFDGSTFDSSPSTPVDKEFNSKTWQAFTPKFGLVYHLTGNTTLRGLVGTGFRAPSPVELYANSTYGSTIVEGNPSLDPEKIVSYEIGASQWFGEYLDVRLTLYRYEIDDLIDTRTVGKEGHYTLMQKDNISRVRGQGIELESYYHITNQWYGFLNYTYNDSIITEDQVNPLIKGNQLAFSPQNKLNIGLTYDNPKLFAGTVQARFVGDSYADNENDVGLGNYWTFDLFLARRLQQHVLLSLAVENIFNRKYDIGSFNTYKAPGTLWALSLVMEF